MSIMFVEDSIAVCVDMRALHKMKSFKIILPICKKQIKVNKSEILFYQK